MAQRNRALSGATHPVILSEAKDLASLRYVSGAVETVFVACVTSVFLWGSSLRSE
ncbi:MAG: hypothetical protein JWO45_430 [Spartobacteria bacterium]|nr:hypothetical protein [Spartobacteria bacterium]